MVDIDEVQKLIQGLMTEHDAVIQEREVLRQEQVRIGKRAEELDRKITGLKQSLQGLSLYTTAKNTPPELTKTERGVGEMIAAMGKLEMGPRTTPKTLTECCRDILAISGEWMTALQVRQGLHAANFDFSEYKSNPLSSIHTTLKRIAESGQAATRFDIRNDENLYCWKKDGAEPPPPVVQVSAGSRKSSSRPPDTEKKK